MNPSQMSDEKSASSKEVLILSTKSQEFKEKILPSEQGQMIPQLTALLQHIDPADLDEPSILSLAGSLETISKKMSCCIMVDKEKGPVYEAFFETMLKKVVQIFSNTSKYHLAVMTLKTILKHDHSLLFGRDKAMFASVAEAVPTALYLNCLNFLRKQLKNQCKQVWKMTLQDIVDVFELFNYLERSRNTKTQVGELYEEYYTELVALFQSGRPELQNFAVSEKLNIILDCLERSIQYAVKKQQYEQLIPILGKTLILNNHRLAGIKLLNTHCRRVYDIFYNSQAVRLKNWLNKNQVYDLILSGDMTEEEYDQSKHVLSFCGRGTDGMEKNSHLLKLMRENKSKNKWVVKFCMKEIEVYAMSANDKAGLVSFISAQEDLCENYPEYNDCLDELIFRLDYNDPKVIEEAFNMIYKIAKNGSHLTEMYQRKLMNNLKGATRCLKTAISKKTPEQRMQFVKKLASDLLAQVNCNTIAMFNIIFAESDLYKAFSNNPFQTVLNFIIEDIKLLSRIFQFLERGEKIGDLQEVVKTIKFVSTKCTVKIDVTEKYLRTLAKFPDLYECLISNEGYSKIKSQMETVLDLFRTEPDISFHLLKTTFYKANHKKFSEVSKESSLVSYKKEEYRIWYKPTTLEWYQEIISLLEQTQNSVLRKEIAQFIVELHFSYARYQKEGDKQFSSYMDSLVDYFHENSKNYKNKKASAKSMSANIELIIQTMRFTDILGVGQYSPHKSLVPTATITLTILNNATFGDDVQKAITRNFSANMTLFDLLTGAGLAFKCGPEDLVLRQGARFIPVILNGCILSDIGFTSEEIVAEKNQANYLMAPEVLCKNKEGKSEFTDVYVKCLKQVFQRFSFEGKMGQIEAVNYLRQASGAYVMSYDRRIREMFEDFDKDNDGILTVVDFLNYNLKSITSQTYEKYYKQQFIKGLINLRYRNNMTLYDEPLNISNRYNIMMRVRLHGCPEIYEELFRLAEDDNEEVMRQARQLLLHLPSYAGLKKKHTEMFDFKDNSPFLIYYKLILIEDELEHDSTASKTDKIALFISKKYNQIIFQLLTHFYENLQLNQYSSQSFSICLKILRSLIAIANLALTSIQQLSFDPLSVHSLPDTTFFIKEALLALESRNVINFEVLLVLQLTQQWMELQPIVEGCFHEDQDIRKICCSFVFLWQEKVHWKDNLFKVSIPEQRSKQWFDLLCAVIEKTELASDQNILTNTLQNLEAREETLYIRKNEGLQGYLNMLKTILQKYQNTKDHPLLRAIIPKLLEKSVCEETRSIVYDILIDVDDFFLANYLKNMLETVIPSQECQVRSEFMGLRNLGATCYLNSILQQFFMIEKFRDLVLSRSVPDGCKSLEVEGKQQIDDFMYQLQKMYYHLQFSQKKYFVPKEFCYSYKDFDGQPINTSIQEDSHQFLNRLIEQVEGAFLKSDLLKTLQKICEVKTLTEIQCDSCKHRIDRIQNHYSCMLEVKEQDSLASSLKKFTGKDQIEGYKCEKCSLAKAISKRTFFYELPQIVILNLQRIIFDPKIGDKIKVHSSLTFPTELDFAEYTKNPDLDQMSTQYRLKGVVIHTGTSEGGHYYSLIKDNRKDRWLKFNDQNVMEFDPKEIPRQSFGGFETKDNNFQQITYSTNAYILFYENVQTKPQEFCEMENLLSEQVHQQNLKLIKEVQTHQQCFFGSIDAIYKRHRFTNIEHSLKIQPFSENVLASPKNDIYPLLLNIHQKAFSFLSVFTAIKPEHRSKITQNLLELYHVAPEETLSFFKELNIDTFVQNLISHNDSTYRECIRKIMGRNIQIFVQYFGVTLEGNRQEDQIVKTVLDALLGRLSRKTLYSSISKSESFFKLLTDLLLNLPAVRSYLNEKQLMFFLLDLLMGRQSAFMKYHLKAHDLPNSIVWAIYPAIHALICSKINFKGVHISNQNHAPFFETTPLEAQIIKSKYFYRHIFRLNYDHDTITAIIFRYSIKDFDYTTMISEILLEQMSKSDPLGSDLQFKRLECILSIEDGLELFRYSYLLGFPQYVQTKPNSFHFCLSTNAQSINTHYPSGIFPNKDEKLVVDNDRKPLLQILFAEKVFRNEAFVLEGLRLFLALAEGSQKIFDYLMAIPPPTYMKTTLFDYVPDLIVKIADEKDFIIESKMETITTITNLIGLLQARIKQHPRKLPVKQYILGKSSNMQTTDMINDDDQVLIKLTLFSAYVLPNLPTGKQNKSMGKQFNGYDIKELANLFIDSRSSFAHAQLEEKVDIQSPFYVLSGKTKVKLLLTIKNEQACSYRIVLYEGPFHINFPNFKDGKIADLVQIELFEESSPVFNQELADQFFGVEKEKEEEMKAETDLSGGKEDEKKKIAEDKIECPACTFLNELTRDRCDVCESPLFL